MENISELDKNNCTGCRMCEQICPVKAIEFVENEEGFIEPKVNEKKCINCGLCFKRCPQLNDIKNNRLDEIKVYAAKNKNAEEQKESSSGGIFSILANYVLENNGIVYGCAFNSNLVAEQIAIKSKEELYKLRGSKYVQSNTQNTFTEAKKDLDNNKLVLYSGTPCQIAGLKAFLDKDYENLITIDLVCHGVPSPKLWKKQLEELERKTKKKIKKIKFRDKDSHNWEDYGFSIVWEDNTNTYIPSGYSPYIKSFLEGKICRECCYRCKYSKEERMGDITVADYWGIEKEYPDFYDKNGVSAVIINTKKGESIFKEINCKINYINTKLDSVRKYNINLNHPTIRPQIRKDVYKNIDNKKFIKYIKNDLKYKKKLKDQIKNLIPSKIRQHIKHRLK